MATPKLSAMSRRQLAAYIGTLGNEHADQVAQLQGAHTELVTRIEADLLREKKAHSHCDMQRRAIDEVAKLEHDKVQDLKEQLAFSEAEVQRMGGYISRVQEDDVVRDPLVQVGDPDGEQQLVPKRKPTHFHHLQPVREAGCVTSNAEQFLKAAGCATDRPKRPRHWVRY